MCTLSCDFMDVTEKSMSDFPSFNFLTGENKDTNYKTAL